MEYETELPCGHHALFIVHIDEPDPSVGLPGGATVQFGPVICCGEEIDTRSVEESAYEQWLEADHWRGI